MGSRRLQILWCLGECTGIAQELLVNINTLLFLLVEIHCLCNPIQSIYNTTDIKTSDFRIYGEFFIMQVWQFSCYYFLAVTFAPIPYTITKVKSGVSTVSPSLSDIKLQFDLKYEYNKTHQLKVIMFFFHSCASCYCWLRNNLALLRLLSYHNACLILEKVKTLHMVCLCCGTTVPQLTNLLVPLKIKNILL